MRLSEWRAHAPVPDAVSLKVVGVVESALRTIGADADPECWIVWGDDPAIRYVLFAPTPAGLVQVNVRVMVPGEGPRAAAKVIRWSRVQMGELAVEIHGGHRLVTFQVESQVLSGVDDLADAIALFAGALFAAVDGRPMPSRPLSTATAQTAPPAARKAPAKAAAPKARARKPPAAQGS
jgi:hypothetical protein